MDFLTFLFLFFLKKILFHWRHFVFFPILILQIVLIPCMLFLQFTLFFIVDIAQIICNIWIMCIVFLKCSWYCFFFFHILVSIGRCCPLDRWTVGPLDRWPVGLFFSFSPVLFPFSHVFTFTPFSHVCPCVFPCPCFPLSMFCHSCILAFSSHFPWFWPGLGLGNYVDHFQVNPSVWLAT